MCLLAAILAQQLYWASPCSARDSTPWPQADRLFHSDPLWLGGDGAFSVDLGNGRVLWLFGDSFIAHKVGDKRPACNMVRNSLAIESGYDPSTASIKFYWRKQNGEAQSFFPSNEGEWLWPLHGIRLGRQLLLFYNVIRADSSPGSLGFRGLRATAFVVDNCGAPPDQWRYREVAVPQNNWTITLGVAVLRRDAFLYVFGFDEPKHDICVVRMPVTAAQGGDLLQLEWWSATDGTWTSLG